MKWQYLLAAATSFLLVPSRSDAARYQVSDAECDDVAKLLNIHRANPPKPATKMKQLTCDHNLLEVMKTFVGEIDPHTLFDQTTAYPPIPGYTRNEQVFHVTKLPKFLAIPGADQYAQCRFWVLDTFAARKKVIDLFTFRIKGALGQKCFDLAKCNSSTYDDYKSCDRLPSKGPGTQCQGDGRYYGEYLAQYHQSFACVTTGVQGPASPRPGTQHNSFFCIVCDGEQADQWPPKNDIPYETGSSASQCGSYADYSETKHGSCVPSSAGRRTLTFSNTTKYLRGEDVNNQRERLRLH